jgi:hypothetical protein
MWMFHPHYLPAGPVSIRICLLISVFVILAPVFCSQAAAAQAADLGLSLVPEQGGVPVSEVAPNQTFNYNITVKNNCPVCQAEDAVLTIKLPYDALYIGAQIYPISPVDYSIRQSGDLLQAEFQELLPGSSRYVNITMTSPGVAPSTLYITARLRYDGDPNPGNNTATISTYVPLAGYNKTEATKSFEDLLHNQSYLLFTFQDLLMQVPQGIEENYSFTVSFEQLLRSQARLTDSFQDLLANESGWGWDEDFGKDDRLYLLRSYETMLRDEAGLFAGFEAKINGSWHSLDGYTAPGHSMDAQWELLASLEDLLKRQVGLYKGFAILFNEIDENADSQEREAQVEFLSSFEDLLRRQSDLLKGFEQIMKKKLDSLGPSSYEEYRRVQSMDLEGYDWGEI